MKPVCRHIAVLATAALLFSSTPAHGQSVGPSNGWLVIVGGAMRDPAILDRFLTLAGGVEGPVVVIPTAGGAETYDESWPGLNMFRDAGATDVTLLHTYDRAVANTKEFAEPLTRARAVWFGGGRQWRLVDSYAGTEVEKEVSNVLRRGGVVGGSSAGATIQGSYLARGDTATNTVMMEDHEEGFGYLRNVAIDQHLLARNRHFDMLEIIQARPDLLGIGLDENAAIVVRGDEFEVIGQSYVAIFDRKRQIDTGGLFYFLSPGDRYNLQTREPFRPRMALEPLERVVRRDWPEGEQP